MSDSDPLGIRAMEDRTAIATSVYAYLKSTGKLHEHILVTYRCVDEKNEKNRCALLEIFETLDGTIVGFPRFKTSPATTRATSNEAGRSKSTEDGLGKFWIPHAAFSDAVSNPRLSCDHINNVLLTDDAIREDLAAGHAEVRVRRDGSRYSR